MSILAVILKKVYKAHKMKIVMEKRVMAMKYNYKHHCIPENLSIKQVPSIKLTQAHN